MSTDVHTDVLTADYTRLFTDGDIDDSIAVRSDELSDVSTEDSSSDGSEETSDGSTPVSSCNSAAMPHADVAYDCVDSRTDGNTDHAHDDTQRVDPMTPLTITGKAAAMETHEEPHPPALRRVVLAANQKGGVGKTSIVTALGGLIARPERRVLVIDADPQGNATSSDLGVDGDRGRSLTMALQYGEPLRILQDVRPGLDLVPGGPLLAQVGALTATATQTGLDIVSNLRQALTQACAAGNYTVVLIDSGPGDAPLLDALLRTTRYLIVPTRDDDASLSGVELLALRYLKARQEGAAVQLLGVVLFDANPRATARNGQVLADLDIVLDGSGATCFQTMIRSDRAAALDLRAAHLTPAELVDAAATQSKSRLAQLRRGGRHRAEREPEEDEVRLWSRDPSALASDYQSLARELMGRIASVERGTPE